MVYLDHAGATLYSEAQMADVAKDLMSNVYGNPRILKFGICVRKRHCCCFFLIAILLRKLLWLCSLTYFLDSQSDSSMATSDLVTSMRHQVLHIIKIPDLPVLVFVFSIICKLIYIQCKESTLKINRCCNSFVGKRTPMLVIGIHYLFYARHLTIFMSVSAYRLK